MHYLFCLQSDSLVPVTFSILSNFICFLDISLSPFMEGLVILKPNPEYEAAGGEAKRKS